MSLFSSLWETWSMHMCWIKSGHKGMRMDHTLMLRALKLILENVQLFCMTHQDMDLIWRLVSVQIQRWSSSRCAVKLQTQLHINLRRGGLKSQLLRDAFCLAQSGSTEIFMANGQVKKKEIPRQIIFLSVVVGDQHGSVSHSNAECTRNDDYLRTFLQQGSVSHSNAGCTW